MGRRRQLSDEELALWSGFARSVTLLRGPHTPPKLPRAPLSAPAGLKLQSGRSHEVPPARPAVKALPLAPLGPRLRQRIARGREPIDARIDLHGLTQRQAHHALLSFLQRAQADGAKVVLVVTGKGGGGARDTERGVLRRQVPNWLSLPQMRPCVLGFEPAQTGHGGEGALYVRLRRRR